MAWKISLLGVRGSVPITGQQFKKYGGDTLCVLVETEEEVILFDAGTGILNLKNLSNHIHILIGHPHADHIMGLGLCKCLNNSDVYTHFYMTPRNNEGCQKMLERLYSPPLWSVFLEQLPSKMKFHNISGSFFIGNIKVDTLEGNHPGGVTHFKISDGNKTIVYAVDCELDEKSEHELIEFAKDCDILFCDGMYRECDFPNKKGWGHNTWLDAAELGENCNAKHTVIVHFDINETDEILDNISKQLSTHYPKCELGKQEEVWII